MFSIIRDGEQIELTRKELEAAAKTYERIAAEEIMVVRLKYTLGADVVTNEMVDIAVEEYLRCKGYDCDEEYSIENAIWTAEKVLR